jgi:hypothetical protein
VPMARGNGGSETAVAADENQRRSASCIAETGGASPTSEAPMSQLPTHARNRYSKFVLPGLFRSADVLFEKPPLHCRLHGMIAMDLLNTARRVTLDFRAMRLTVPTANLIWGRRQPTHTCCESDARAVFSSNKSRSTRSPRCELRTKVSCRVGKREFEHLSRGWNCGGDCYVQAARRS